MKLSDLTEAVGQKSYVDLMGLDDPVNIQVQQKLKEKGKTKRHLVDEFYIRFKPEFGGGYYKVRVKHIKEKGVVYNHGYFDRTYLPEEISFDTAKMTKEGQADWRRFVEYLNNHPESVVPKASKQLAKDREKQIEKAIGIKK